MTDAELEPYVEKCFAEFEWSPTLLNISRGIALVRLGIELAKNLPSEEVCQQVVRLKQLGVEHEKIAAALFDEIEV